MPLAAGRAACDGAGREALLLRWLLEELRLEELLFFFFLAGAKSLTPWHSTEGRRSSMAAAWASFAAKPRKRAADRVSRGKRMATPFQGQRRITAWWQPHRRTIFASIHRNYIMP